MPEDEQLAIVDEALIPPLRDGDVHASFVAGLDRLENSIRNGPPVDAFERWSADVGGSWLPWIEVGLAAVGLAVCMALFGRRERTSMADLPPTTSRPTDLHPALGGALAKGGPQASAVPATLLDLASRGGIDIEPESEGGTFSQPTVQLRLRDQDAVTGPIDKAMWSELLKHAGAEVVSSKGITGLATDSKQVRDAVEAELVERDWWDSRAGVRKGWLIAIFVLAISLGGPRSPVRWRPAAVPVPCPERAPVGVVAQREAPEARHCRSHQPSIVQRALDRPMIRNTWCLRSVDVRWRFEFVADSGPWSDRLQWIGRNAKRIVTLVVGTAIVVAGVAMLALPGPGIVVIIIGLLILATEFSWAERALDTLMAKGKDALAKVQNNESTRRVTIVSSVVLVVAGIVVAVLLDGFVFAGVAISFAGVLGLCLLSPRVQTWIEEQDGS